MIGLKQFTAILLLLPMVLFSCLKKHTADDDIIVPIINSNGDTIVDPVKGTLLFHENFQKWERSGYFLSAKEDCDNDLMKSTSVMYFIPTTVQVAYDDLTVTYSLIDFAVNPECGNKAGTSDTASDISLGYIALQCPIYLTCGHYTKGYIETNAISSVSFVEFTVSYGDNSKDGYADGISLWKKTEDDDDYIKIGTYIPDDPSTGQKFTVQIDAKNVIIRLKAEKKAKVEYANEIDDTLVNRSVRIHDLYLWKPISK
jgi:hypothetical protein